MTEIAENDVLEMTAEIVSSFVANNPVQPGALPDLIKAVHATIDSLAKGGAETGDRPEPAVPIEKSITPEHLICLEDGKKLKMLKRYLRTRYDLTPEDYRKRWGLPLDYPMVAPNYAKRRSKFAKEIGLGKTPKTKAKPKRK